MQKRNKIILYVVSIAATLAILYFISIYSIVVLIVAGILFLPAWYIYRKSIKVFDNKHFKYILLGLMIAFSFTFPLGFLGIHVTENHSSVFFRSLTAIGFFYLPAALNIFITTLLISLLAFLGKTLKIVKKETIENPKVRLSAFCFIIALSVALLFISHYNQAETDISRYSIELPKKPGSPDSLRVVIISDLHLTFSTPDDWLKEKVAMINRLNPDLVLIPGDIIDNNSESLRDKPFPDDFKALKARLGVYAVTGNHEHFGNYPKNVKYILNSGIGLINDSLVLVDSSFYIAGRLDRTQKNRKSLSTILEHKTLDLPVILMDHQPIGLDEAIENKVDIQASGHTHNGQLFPINIVTSLVYKISWGYEKIGNTHFFVSSGLGLWGPQYRLGSTSEIILTDIKFR